MTFSESSQYDASNETNCALHQQPFDFSLVRRNLELANQGHHPPKSKKTGTTIAGLVYNDGVILGADTRATEGSIVCDKNCEKIHFISKNIYCCGAGTAADTENVTNLVSSQLELLRLATNEEPRVITALTRLKQHLFQYQGYISAALVLGGVDAIGSHIYTVYPHGSTDRLPFATMGSGSLAAMSIFEAEYKDNLTETEGIQLVSKAIKSGVFNDLGSGSNVDICVISKTNGVKYLRNNEKPNERLYKRQMDYGFKRGTTEWLQDTERIFKAEIQINEVRANEMEIV